MKAQLEVVNGEQAKAEREKADRELEELREVVSSKQNEIDTLTQQLKQLSEDFESQKLEMEENSKKSLKEMELKMTEQNEFKDKYEISSQENR